MASLNILTHVPWGRLLSPSIPFSVLSLSYRDREREIERERQTDRERDTDRETERQRDRQSSQAESKFLTVEPGSGCLQYRDVCHWYWYCSSSDMPLSISYYLPAWSGIIGIGWRFLVAFVLRIRGACDVFRSFFGLTASTGSTRRLFLGSFALACVCE